MVNKQLLRDKDALFHSGLLLTALILLLGDILGDFVAGTSFSHIAVEAIIVLAIICALKISLKAILTDYKEQLRLAEESIKTQEGVVEKYRQQSKNFQEGLGEEIEKHMLRWKLTVAEKEVALLLIKGLLTKEIGQIRGVKEKTIRQQSLSIYRKSGLGNRSELAAFFLEDLLVPSSKIKQQNA